MKTNPSSLACIAGIFFGCMKVCFFGKNEYWKQSIQSTALQPLETSSTSVERPPKFLLPMLTKTIPTEKTICKLTIIIVFST